MAHSDGDGSVSDNLDYSSDPSEYVLSSPPDNAGLLNCSAPPRVGFLSRKMLPKLNELEISPDFGEMSISERLSKMSKSSPLRPTFSRRTKSLAGPSPVCRFGPKAQLFHSEKDVACIIQDPGTTRLNWSSQPQSVLVVKKVRDEDVLDPFVELLRCLLKKNMTVFVEHAVLSEEHLLNNKEFVLMSNRLSTFKEHCDEMNGRIDFIICLGGDGTLLYASSLFQTSVPPVMAFHLGSLGFLTPFEFDNIENRIDCVIGGHANLTLRSRLHTVIAKRRKASRKQINGFGDKISSSLESDDETEDSAFVVLNDVVIDRGPSPYLVNIDLYVDGILITTVQGDGLIISTPTGSTAYAVAAGASIVHPGVPAIMITPICPHSLSFRPVMVPAGCELKLMVSQNARDHGWVSFDGRNRQKLDYEDVLTITTSVYPLPSICQSDQVQDWFTGLAACLNWNVRKQQKPLGKNGHNNDSFTNGSSDHL